MLDIHCHLLPGVDDGAKDTAQCQAMLDAAFAAGIRHIIATPHIYDYDTPRLPIQKAFRIAKRLAMQRGITLLQGYEVNWQALPGKNADDLRPLCVEGTQTLLLELPSERMFPGWQELLSSLTQQIHIIIAHPERYVYMKKDLAIAKALVEMGCEMQVDADVLGKRLGEGKVAHKLLDAQLVHYIASDAHDEKDYQAVTRHKEQWMNKGLLCGKLPGDTGKRK